MGEGVHAGSALPVPAGGCGSVPDTHCVILSKGQSGVMPTARWGWGIRHAGMGAFGVYPDPPPPFLPKLRCSGGQSEPGSASGSQLWTSALMERTCSQAPSGSLSGVPMPALHPQPPLGSWVGAGRACVAPRGSPNPNLTSPPACGWLPERCCCPGRFGDPHVPEACFPHCPVGHGDSAARFPKHWRFLGVSCCPSSWWWPHRVFQLPYPLPLVALTHRAGCPQALAVIGALPA